MIVKTTSTSTGQWLASALLSAALLGLIELTLAGYAAPFTVGTATQSSRLFGAAFAMLLPLALALAFVCGQLERRVPAFLRPSASTLTAALIGLSAAVLGLSRVRAVLGEGTVDFPDEVARTASVGAALVCVASAALGWLLAVLLPRAFERLRWARGDVLLCAALLVAWAGFLVRGAYFALAPIHLGKVAGPVMIAALGALMLSARLVLPVHAPKRLFWFAWLPLPIWLALLVGMGPLADASARYALFHHVHGAGWVAARLSDLSDFDRDQAAPTWLGGTDCAPFDAARGPLRREIPGDGIDQDCRGGDAARASTWPARDTTARCELNEPLSVVLITIDALRFDALRTEVMPGLLSFARQSAVFARAYTAAGFTILSMGSMFSGKTLADQRPEHGDPHNVDLGHPIAAQLQSAGYATASFNLFEISDALYVGFSQITPGSFDTQAGNLGTHFASNALTTNALTWIDAQTQDPQKPFFAWIHYPDAHAPYMSAEAMEVPERFTRGLSNYEVEAQYVDHQLGLLLSGISTRGLALRTAILITADHGEDLETHGDQGHGLNVFEDTAHVPLILWVPRCAPQLVEPAVSLTQVAPTIAQLAGLSRPGHSLLSRDARPALPVVSEAWSDLLRFEQPTYKRAIIDGDLKLIVDVLHGGALLFDLTNDPHETLNLYNKSDAATQRMRGLYQRWLDRGAR